MGTRVLKQALPDERLTQQELNVFLSPVAGRKSLEKHHNLLCSLSVISVSDFVELSRRI